MKQLHNIASTKEILILDALRYSLEIERKAYVSLKRSLKKIEKTHEKEVHPSESVTLSALLNAWVIVDTTYRIRGLVGQVKGLSQKSQELQVFLRSTASIKDFRDLYQHLNSEIPKITGATNPIMGVVSWVASNPADSLTVFLSTGSAEIQAHTVAYDNWNHCFAQKLLFSAGNKDIELDKLHMQCSSITKYLKKWLKSKNYLSNEPLKPSIIKFGIRRKTAKEVDLK